jgi:hypothetical protein
MSPTVDITAAPMKLGLLERCWLVSSPLRCRRYSFWATICLFEVGLKQLLGNFSDYMSTKCDGSTNMTDWRNPRKVNYDSCGSSQTSRVAQGQTIATLTRWLDQFVGAGKAKFALSDSSRLLFMNASAAQERAAEIGPNVMIYATLPEAIDTDCRCRSAQS